MNSDPLAQLQDISLPQQVGNWPLAWGWWLIIVLSLISLLILVYLVRQYWRNRESKRQALKLLASLNYQQHGYAAVNDILKRLILTLKPREQVAQLTGQQWVNFLDNHTKKGQSFTLDDFNKVYQKQVEERDFNEFCEKCQLWIKDNVPLKQIRDNHV